VNRDCQGIILFHLLQKWQSTNHQVQSRPVERDTSMILSTYKTMARFEALFNYRVRFQLITHYHLPVAPLFRFVKAEHPDE